LERLHGLFSCMERAEWLLLMNVKRKLLAMAGDFTGAISQARFPEVLFPNFALQQSMPPPATWGVRSPVVGSLTRW